MPVRPLLVVLSALTLALVLLSETPSEAGMPAATCFGREPTRRGTFGDDTITGTSGSDVILARSGNDTVHGMGGGDFICGNEGQDTLNGNGGNDRISGGPRDDTINGGFNNDTLQGNDGNDTLNGDPGDDKIDGGGGTDDCDGGTGTNSISNCEDGGGSTAIALVDAFPGESFSNPMDIDPVPGTTNDYVVSQRNGLVFRVINGDSNQIGDLSSLINTSGEGGLLGLVFSTNFGDDNDVYVYYTRDSAGSGTILEGQLSRFDLSDLTPPFIEDQILTVSDITQSPMNNHNGGGLDFGGDGYLYLGVGDGGDQGDPFNNAQNINVLAGKILRLDVEGVDGEADIIPDSNPFAGQTAGKDEIFLFGYRNPWRLSFDRANPNNLWIGDVGGSLFEEVNMINTVSPPGRDYGWDVMEGFGCRVAGCSTSGRILPVAVYDHGSGASISGGFVYRGADIPGLVGQYIYADFVRGEIRRTPATGSNQSILLLETALGIVGLGQDFDGELLVIDFNGGEIYRIVPAP